MGLALDIDRKLLVSNSSSISASVVAYVVQLAELSIWVAHSSSNARGHERVLHVIYYATFESIAARNP